MTINTHIYAVLQWLSSLLVFIWTRYTKSLEKILIFRTFRFEFRLLIFCEFFIIFFVVTQFERTVFTSTNYTRTSEHCDKRERGTPDESECSGRERNSKCK